MSCNARGEGACPEVERPEGRAGAELKFPSAGPVHQRESGRACDQRCGTPYPEQFTHDHPSPDDLLVCCEKREKSLNAEQCQGGVPGSGRSRTSTREPDEEKRSTAKATSNGGDPGESSHGLRRGQRKDGRG